MGLRAAFLSAWKGAAPGGALDAALADAARRGSAAWPDVGLDDQAFARCLAERAPAELPPEVGLARLCIEDLYLACGCARADAAALRAFEERILSRVPAYLSRIEGGAQLVEETRQALRTRLFVAADGAEPRICKYSGLGALDAWVRVAAVRAALNILETEKRHIGSRLPDEQLLPSGSDLELDFLREHYREAFAAALQRAITELPASDRALLRLHFVDGLSPGRIGGILGVHRTTTLRRIVAAKRLLLEATRAHVMRDLQLSPSECDSLLAQVRGHLPITLASLFRSKTPEL